MDVGVDDLKPGMILTHPVHNHQGVLLLEAGAKITRKQIRIFKSWGISRVQIRGAAAEANRAEEAAEQSFKENIEAQLREKFGDVMHDPVMVEIFKAARRQLIENLQDHRIENERS